MNLREIRESKGFDLVYVSKMTGVTKGILKKFEDGQYDLKLSEAKSIARFFKINIYSLIGKETSSNASFNVKFEKNLLKLRRKAMMFRNNEFASSIGISTKILGEIENRDYDIRISLLFKICESLKLDIEEVLICA
ncbi:helix-turn-helix domain-containing protein [Clostridium sp. UBA1652]|uniref:helix-turn-helix domain-containing protein n=1 Tax=Clostridium sp. UBA1652 TaxID=1946348 RepID=UPI00257DFDA8|nr:helix-turn-helix domain-containing protein [Clostridium sp. UBA1652]